jgi:hypothetical protein
MDFEKIRVERPSKKNIKLLKKWAEENWSKEEVDVIFDPSDDCFCSMSLREAYKKRFFNKWDIKK